MGTIIDLAELPVRDLQKLCRLRFEATRLGDTAQDALERVIAEEAELDRIERDQRRLQAEERRRDLTRLRVQKHRRNKAVGATKSHLERRREKAANGAG